MDRDSLYGKSYTGRKAAKSRVLAFTPLHVGASVKKRKLQLRENGGGIEKKSLACLCPYKKKKKINGQGKKKVQKPSQRDKILAKRKNPVESALSG